jgi:hypothetical protein
MASTATPVSAATEQEHQHNDDQDQFHGISPLMVTALFAEHLRRREADVDQLQRIPFILDHSVIQYERDAP